MTWHAKLYPSHSEGRYVKNGTITSEGVDNIKEFYKVTSSLGYTKEATAGMLGNVYTESGFNPWAWQDGHVSSNYSNGYGLFQYTPARGYINDYGKGLEYYAPCLSVKEITEGAKATDAIAQINAISTSGKYSSGYPDTTVNVNRVVKLGYSNWRDYRTINQFKEITDVATATAFWLCFFEKPADASSEVFEVRFLQAKTCYEILEGTEPTPDPPSPPTPDPPSPPAPSTSTQRKLPIWFYILRRRF